MAVACIALVLYAFLGRRGRLDHYPKNGWLLVAEALITLFITMETVADMIVYGCQEYWRNGWRVFDFIVCILCLIGLVIDYVHWYFYMRIDDYISVGLLIVRYVVQSFRIYRVLRQANIATTNSFTVDETQIKIPGCHGSARMPDKIARDGSSSP